MAMRTVCDVYDTHKEVTTYQVRLAKVVKPPDAESSIEVIAYYEAELCPRAVKRLEKLITKGIHPPGWKAE